MIKSLARFYKRFAYCETDCDKSSGKPSLWQKAVLIKYPAGVLPSRTPAFSEKRV